MNELARFALLLLVFGVLLGVSVLFSRASERFGLPIALIFMVVGMLAGVDGPGGIEFGDFHLAFRLGTAALVLILFDGGLNTPLTAVRRAILPAGILATVGVAGTAALMAIGARLLLGFSWPLALLLGAIVSSTDAAAVFSVLRGSGLHLRKRLAATIEVESGLNDPMAMILTIVLTENLITPGGINLWRTPAVVVLELAIGVAAGWAIGLGGRRLLMRLKLPAEGLYPVLTVALASLAFALPTLMHGSGLLGVYVAGVTLGAGDLPYRAGIFRVHDALAWLSQITMFLLLGLLVNPSHLPAVAVIGLVLALLLAFVARPLVVALCLWPLGFARKEIGYIGWVGLRGAVPIILATVPVLAGASGAEGIFNVVFFIAVVNAFVPGATVPFLTRRLRLQRVGGPEAPTVLALNSREPLKGLLLSFHVDGILAVSGLTIGDLELPEDSAVILLVRGRTLLPPRPELTLEAGDQVYVVAQPEDRGLVQLLFGRPDQD
ncbi:MAG: potassium/proton antiporter [Bacillota bacterium]